MSFFSKLFKGPEIDMEKSNANAMKISAIPRMSVVSIMDLFMEVKRKSEI